MTALKGCILLCILLPYFILAVSATANVKDLLSLVFNDFNIPESEYLMSRDTSSLAVTNEEPYVIKRHFLNQNTDDIEVQESTEHQSGSRSIVKNPTSSENAKYVTALVWLLALVMSPVISRYMSKENAGNQAEEVIFEENFLDQSQNEIFDEVEVENLPELKEEVIEEVIEETVDESEVPNSPVLMEKPKTTKELKEELDQLKSLLMDVTVDLNVYYTTYEQDTSSFKMNLIEEIVEWQKKIVTDADYLINKKSFSWRRTREDKTKLKEARQQYLDKMFPLFYDGNPFSVRKSVTTFKLALDQIEKAYEVDLDAAKKFLESIDGTEVIDDVEIDLLQPLKEKYSTMDETEPANTPSIESTKFLIDKLEEGLGYLIQVNNATSPSYKQLQHWLDNINLPDDELLLAIKGVEDANKEVEE